MAVLKLVTSVIVQGSVVHAGTTFECPDSLADSLIQRGFAFPIQEAEHVKEAGSVETLYQNDTNGIQPTDSSPLDARDAEIEVMRKEYAGMKVGELLELAESNGIDTTSLSRKSEYIDALIHYELGE
nr:MAG TPA: endoplasmic reticulum chaperone [Caudoviricetes sp.]